MGRRKCRKSSRESGLAAAATPTVASRPAFVPVLSESSRMATRSSGQRRERDSDFTEALKPLVVLVLFGTILYGAYSVVQKGPSPAANEPAAVAGDAPPFVSPPAQPQVDMRAAVQEAPVSSAPPTAVQPPAPPAPAPAPIPVADATRAPAVAAVYSPLPPLQPPAGIPAAPPPPLDVASRTAAAPQPAAGLSAGDTYLTPSAPEGRPPSSGDEAVRPERVADAGGTTVLPLAPPQPPVGIRAASPSSAAFAAAWAEAHGMLRGGRYAEALAGLSVWYDDPSLGLEESQQLEDLLSRLAGTVVYSQQDLLLPPHVVAPGETLAAIAAPLGVSWQLLAKINGVEDPSRLVPGEHLKLLRGPFEAVLSVSRRRLSLQLNGSYAGSFPVVIGREYLTRVGSVLPVATVSRGASDRAQPGVPPRKSIGLGGGFVIEAADDPAANADATPVTSLVVSVRDLEELLDILGPGSRVLVRQ